MRAVETTCQDLGAAARDIERFCSGGLLNRRIRELETQLAGATAEKIPSLLADASVDRTILSAALALKSAVGQLNVVIHAVNVLLLLPVILNNGEHVTYLSLGAGSTGKEFDLKTNQRVAEFKFIDWKGGSEVSRQNALFKDFYQLAEYEGAENRFLYVRDSSHPLRFLNGGRDLDSVLSSKKLREAFHTKYDQHYKVVSEYYLDNRSKVDIVGLADMVSLPRVELND